MAARVVHTLLLAVFSIMQAVDQDLPVLMVRRSEQVLAVQVAVQALEMTRVSLAQTDLAEAAEAPAGPLVVQTAVLAATV
jgi:hypothetical protein